MSNFLLEANGAPARERRAAIVRFDQTFIDRVRDPLLQMLEEAAGSLPENLLDPFTLEKAADIVVDYYLFKLHRLGRKILAEDIFVDPFARYLNERGVEWNAAQIQAFLGFLVESGILTRNSRNRDTVFHLSPNTRELFDSTEN